jgi:hypothetical protein
LEGGREMRKIFFVIMIILFLGCSPTKYKVEMIKPDGSIDVYIIKTYSGSQYIAYLSKDRSIQLYFDEGEYNFEPGKYIAWHIEKSSD